MKEEWNPTFLRKNLGRIFGRNGIRPRSLKANKELMKEVNWKKNLKVSSCKWSEFLDVHLEVAKYRCPIWKSL